MYDVTNAVDYSQISIKSNNWLYKGIIEWTLTSKYANPSVNIFTLNINGFVGNGRGYYYSNGIRPTFYLKRDIVINKTAHTGSKTDPYRIVTE